MGYFFLCLASKKTTQNPLWLRHRPNPPATITNPLYRLCMGDFITKVSVLFGRLYKSVELCRRHLLDF